MTSFIDDDVNAALDHLTDARSRVDMFPPWTSSEDRDRAEEMEHRAMEELEVVLMARALHIARERFTAYLLQRGEERNRHLNPVADPEG